MRVDLPKAVAEIAPLDPLWAWDQWNIVGHDANKQHRPVQHLIVLQIEHERPRRLLSLTGEKDRDAGDAVLWRLLASDEEFSERHRSAGKLRHHQSAAGAPGAHDRKHDEPDHQREPGAARDLHRVRAE